MSSGLASGKRMSFEFFGGRDGFVCTGGLTSVFDPLQVAAVLVVLSQTAPVERM